MRSIYRWHRRLSLIIALPVVLSAGSGILHPIMTNFRPAVATQGLMPLSVEVSALRVSIEAALDSNRIDSVSRVRLVHIDSNWFYQVQRWGDDVPVYLSAKNGHKLYQGDWLYAQWLARQFLEGPRAGAWGTDRARGPRVTPSVISSASSSVSSSVSNDEPDCCNEATSSVLYAGGCRVLGAVRLTDFDEEYNEVNRLMPVYRVAFDRPDGIRIYVETTQDRFAFAVDNRRAAFNRVFEYIHTYQWLDILGRGRHVVEFLLIGLAFVTTVLGIYIFFSTSGKRVPGNTYIRARRNHRYTAIVISLFTLAFTFSGAYHALSKLKDVVRGKYVARFAPAGLRPDVAALAAVAGGPVSGLSVVNVEGSLFWRVRLLDGAVGVRAAGGVGSAGRAGVKPYKKDLMRDMRASEPEIVYVRVSDGRLLPDGEQRYARWLAGQFSGRPETQVVATTLVTRFDRDYNFTDKRLPVWRVGYPSNHHERYYVETSSGVLAARVDDLDAIESYSFALLHKHEFLGGLGKGVKDFSTMFWAAAQILLVALGLVLWVRQRRRLARTDAKPS